MRNTLVKAGVASGLGLSAFYAFEAAQYRRASGRGFDIADAPPVGSPEFSRLIEALTGAPLRLGNRVQVLRNGCRIFPAMLDAIAAAEHTIDFATYAYWTGDIAPEFANALCARAKAGIEVNVLLDAVGASKMDRSLVDDLERSGANVEWFRPPHWYALEKVNNRTHRKILVVDGSVAFTGGVGIAEEWTGDCEDPDHWRDTHVRVEGPVARDILGGFLENWAEARRSILTGRHLPSVDGFDDGVRAQVTRSSAKKGSTEAEQLFYTAIVGAREKLWITTAYFAPRQAFVDVLKDAVDRGVDVRLIVNGPHIDHDLVRRAGHVSFGELLDGGVRIFEYQRTMLHAKVTVVDGVWSSIGSMNFDNRSFALNDELNLSIQDAAVAREFEAHFEQDLADSIELTPESWKDRPLSGRAKEMAAALIRREL
ncbi:MAG: cardiolipin synthase B [Actinobacteria bacterium]|nr:cardiolipin synthase B [Actinomycetota bacterium]